MNTKYSNVFDSYEEISWKLENGVLTIKIPLSIFNEIHEGEVNGEYYQKDKGL